MLIISLICYCRNKKGGRPHRRLGVLRERKKEQDFLEASRKGRLHTLDTKSSRKFLNPPLGALAMKTCHLDGLDETSPMCTLG